VVNSPASKDKVVFVVTIDVEADNEWRIPPIRTYQSIMALPTFQALCDRYDVRPTYLVTYDVAVDKDSLAVLKELLDEGNCEIGAHTHPWRTPPFYAPLDSENVWGAYLYEYPRDIQARKLAILTDHLQQLFQVDMTSHRAGRWGIDPYGMTLLQNSGYQVDTSVTPFRSWRQHKSGAAGAQGPDYIKAPCRPYHPANDDVCLRGRSGILEILVSVRVFSSVLRVNWGRRLAGLFSGDGFTKRKVRNILRRLGIADLVSLNPAVNPSKQMILLCRKLISERQPVLNMAFHSSELIAGGSPEVANSNDEQGVWRALNEVFACICEYSHVQKQTLTEYAREYQHSVID